MSSQSSCGTVNRKQRKRSKCCLIQVVQTEALKLELLGGTRAAYSPSSQGAQKASFRGWMKGFGWVTHLGDWLCRGCQMSRRLCQEGPEDIGMELRESPRSRVLDRSGPGSEDKRSG
eukprot:scaffold276932_cov14-Tisochrysis_lutea.AAC.1